jgi:hypothetical protein
MSRAAKPIRSYRGDAPFYKAMWISVTTSLVALLRPGDDQGRSVSTSSGLRVRAAREDDLAMAEAFATENARLGPRADTVVRLSDLAANVFRAPEDGQIFSSEVAGVVYSLWVTEHQQFSGSVPVAEIMRPEDPHGGAGAGAGSSRGGARDRGLERQSRGPR